MNDSRRILLGAIGEEEFARHIKREMYRRGWCGYHIRYSHATVEGVHTLRNSDHSDAFGFPDWIFAKADWPLLPLELKAGARGRLSKDQKRWLELLNRTRGVDARALWPTDEDEFLALLEGRA
jgi:hypothetical protein